MQFIKQSDRFTNKIISSNRKQQRLKRFLIYLIFILILAFLFYKFIYKSDYKLNEITQILSSDEKATSKIETKKVSLVNKDIVTQYPDAKVIAKINDAPVYDVEVLDFLNNQNSVEFNNLTGSQKKQIIKDYALRKFLVKKAQEENFDKTMVAQNIIQNALKNAMLKNLLEQRVDEDAMKARYEELAQKTREQNKIRLKHIQVPTEKEADFIKLKLNGSRSQFDRYARDFSRDNKTKANAGDLGFVLETKIPKAFRLAISGLNKGDISKVVKTNDGWHILIVDDIKPAMPAKYEKVKSFIKSELTKKTIEDITKELLRDSKIEIIESLDY